MPHQAEWHGTDTMRAVRSNAGGKEV